MRRDDIDLDQYKLLPAGEYKGHIWSIKSHLSKPKVETGERFPMFLFEIRLNQNTDGVPFTSARRIFWDVWPNVGAAVKQQFIPDDDALANFSIEGDEAEAWKQDSTIGKPCIAQIKHRTYQRRTGKTEIEEASGEEIAVMEQAVAYDVQHVWPNYKGKFLSEEQMDGIDSIERQSGEEGGEEEDEDAPGVDDEQPAF